MSLRSRLAAAGAALIAAGAGVVGAATPAQAATPNWPAHYSAPYVDISLYPTFNLTQAATDSGNRFFTLAFILNVGDSCTAGWSSYDKLDSGFMQDDIASLRAGGGDVAISVGGANGQEPASSCTSASALQAQYQRVIDAYKITHLDFDVEGGALSDDATIQRRNSAIKGLESANPSLHVSYTLPVLPTGLTQDGVDLLQNAKNTGVRVDVVNIMAMDYGTANSDMGGAAVSAANALHSQLGQVWSGAPWSMVGITPMIGQNDSQGEIFTASDAQTVTSFAGSKGVTELSFWSAGRDNGGCAGQSYASPSCSGLSQNQWDFTRSFAAFGGSGFTPADPPAGGSGCATAWNSSTAYTGGSVVSYGGHKWTAKWWTQGDKPGTNEVWVDNGTC